MDISSETSVEVEEFCGKCGKPISLTAHLVPTEFSNMFAESFSRMPVDTCGFCTVLFEGKPRLELV